MKNKPYTFIPSKDNLLYFSKLSARQKLEWLEEVNEFVNTFVPKDMREAWERFELQGLG